jgi:hypothetical protein
MCSFTSPVVSIREESHFVRRMASMSVLLVYCTSGRSISSTKTCTSEVVSLVFIFDLYVRP